MSLQWTLVAGVLYAELAIILLLMLPVLSPRTWNKLFKSRFLAGLESQLTYYFYVFVAVLVLLFLDALREMRKYSDQQQDMEHGHGNHMDVELQNHLRLFRAQRNFYISGFALFLFLVIKRLVTLISQNACLQAEKEAAVKQAQSASRAAESLMSTEDDSAKELQEKLQQAQKELAVAKKDVESMKTQADNLSAEYNRLCDEKNLLERKLAVSGGGDKKDD